MKKKKQYKYDYRTMNLQATVVERFRKFYKSFAKTQSDALRDMMDFFEWHGFHPNQRRGKSIMNEILKNRKRTEANIAILRNIEKTQIKPVSLQMDLLFEGSTQQRDRPKRVEKIFMEKTPEEAKFDEAYVAKVKFDSLQFELDDLYAEYQYLVDRVKQIKPAFGQPYLKMEMPMVRFSALVENVKRKRKSRKKKD